MTPLPPAVTALTNPPLLHWSPDPAAEGGYRVMMDCGDRQVDLTTRNNYFMPHAAVRTGACRIVIIPLAADGTEAGPPLNFNHTIPETAWTAPPPRLAPSKSIALGHLLATPSQIDILRSAEAPRAQLREDLMAAAAAPNPLLPAGQPVVEPERYPDGVWNFDLWHRGNQLCFAIEDTILASTLAWLITDDETHRLRALDLMLQVSAWDPTGSTGVWENDHSAQALLHALALSFDAHREHLTPSETKRITDAMAVRAEDIYGLLNPFLAKDLSPGSMNNPDNNHPWFVASAMGIAGLALAASHPMARRWAEWALHLFWGNFLPRGSRTGAWHEGIDYWSYTLFFVFQFADALRNACGADLYTHPFLRATASFKAVCHPPTGPYVPFGDCKHAPPGAFDKLIMMRLASACNNPVAARYVDAIAAPITTARYLFHAALWSAPHSARVATPFPGLPAIRPDTTSENVRHYDDIGWVVAATPATATRPRELFAMRCGPARPHAHADQNSFVLAAGDDKLLWDAGWYDSYLSPHHRDYSSRSIAHNTILVDGEGQLPAVSGVDGRMIHFAHNLTDGIVEATGDASSPLIYGGRLQKFLRHITYRAGQSLVVSDEIQTARGAHQLSFLLHSGLPIAWDASNSTLSVHGASTLLRAKFISEHPVDAILRTEFPTPPGLTSQVLDDAAEYTQQYHLELRTTQPVETWSPRLEIILQPRAAG